jgi:hypothetical protein
MSLSKQPPAVSGRMSLQVRTVEGHFTVLSLPAIDHRILAGETCNYLVGFGTVHEFNKEGLYVRSGPAPALLGEAVPTGDLW